LPSMTAIALPFLLWPSFQIQTRVLCHLYGRATMNVVIADAIRAYSTFMKRRSNATALNCVRGKNAICPGADASPLRDGQRSNYKIPGLKLRQNGQYVIQGGQRLVILGNRQESARAGCIIAACELVNRSLRQPEHLYLGQLQELLWIDIVER
jgi:hypothetical protein